MACIQRSEARYAVRLITIDGVHCVATDSADEQVRLPGDRTARRRDQR